MKKYFLLTLLILLCSYRSHATTYNYDNAKRIQQVTYDNGGVISYEYDTNGNLIKVSPTESVLSDDAIVDIDNNIDTTTEAPKETKGEKKGACFIATAAYGSYFVPKVKTLRDFRDEQLLTNTAGQYFVKQYYQYSPPIADYISKREWLKMVVRSVLTPMVYAIENPIKFLIGLFLLFILILKVEVQNSLYRVHKLFKLAS